MFTLIFCLIAISSSICAHQNNLDTVLNTNIQLHNILAHESPCTWQPSADFIATASATDAADLIALLHTMDEKITVLYRALSQSKRSCRLRTEKTTALAHYAHAQEELLNACQAADEQLQVCRSSLNDTSLCQEQLNSMLATARAHAHSSLRRGPRKPIQRSAYEDGGFYFPPS